MAAPDDPGEHGEQGEQGTAGSTGGTGELDALVEELRTRVAQRVASGEYPPDLSERLDAHFERLTGSRPTPSPIDRDELAAAVDELAHFEFTRGRIPTDSGIPGGSTLHRTIGRVVSRQVQGVLEQSQQYAHLVARTTALLAELVSSFTREHDARVVQLLDDLQVRLADQQRALNALAAGIADVRERVPGTAIDAWYGEERFTAVFRGSTDDLRVRYRGLAERFVGCEPVLDIGFGRGEFLALLDQLGIRAFGAEVDEHLVGEARARGYTVERAGAVECLSGLEPASLGGIVMIQVIEHLTPQQVLDVVSLAADRVRPGGRVVIETVNPTSLFTYAHAFWVDPTHARPVHPRYLEFLFREAGFRQVDIEWRSPVPDDERLLPLPGDDEQTERLNENLRRIDRLLFGPQDYAVIATR